MDIVKDKHESCDMYYKFVTRSWFFFKYKLQNKNNCGQISYFIKKYSSHEHVDYESPPPGL
jgi:hypothetical protein